jgi:hypothetical protein
MPQYSLTKNVFFSTYDAWPFVRFREVDMKKSRSRKPVITTAVLSLASGLFVFMVLWSTVHDHSPQFGLLIFLIGFSLPWLLYFAVWFVHRGFRRTAFPVCSRAIVARIQRITAMDMNPAQRKTLIEAAGAMVMVLCALILAAAAFSLIAGLVYIFGHFRW